VPDGAKFERAGFIFTDERLELPWVSMTPRNERWCFARLRFTASEAQVLLEVRAETPFDPRGIGGAAALEIIDPSGQVVFRAEGPLQDQCCSAPVRDVSRWASPYFNASYGPRQDLKSSYAGRPKYKAKIGNEESIASF